MKVEKLMLLILCLILSALLFSGCADMPGGAKSRYSLEGYNNSGYSGSYQQGGGFDDASIEEERRKREERESRKDSAR
jgi:hypothetical protein